MPLKTILLPEYEVSILPSINIKLLVSTTLDIRSLSQSFLSLDDHKAIKALTSGDIWADRGRGCRIDICIGAGDLLLDQSSRQRILQAVGNHLVEAKMWSQLCLAVKLEMAPSCGYGGNCLSIHIRHDVSPSCGISLTSADILAPTTLVSAQFERLQIHLEFVSLLNTAHASKKAGLSLQSLTSSDIVLSDGDAAQLDDKQFGAEEAMLLDIPSKSANSSTESWTGPAKIYNGSTKTLPLLAPRPDTAPTAPSLIIKRTPVGRKGRFPQWVTDSLTTWLDDNAENPYPTPQQKDEWMAETGLSRTQLNTWFSRRRLRSKINALPIGQSLLQQREDEGEGYTKGIEDEDDDMLMLGDIECHGDEMLFSQDTQTTSLTSISTSSTNPCASRCPALPYQSSHAIDTGGTAYLDLYSAIFLASLAFKTLVNGAAPQGPRVALKPTPKISMSQLIPKMFSPGFSHSLDYNSRFFSTISHAICSSWPRNVQSPILQARIMALSSLQASEYEDHPSYHDNNTQSLQRLADIVQTRLWFIMQRKLFDATAARKLECTPPTANAKRGLGGNEDDLMLFDGFILQDTQAKNEEEGITAKAMAGGDLASFISQEFPDLDEAESNGEWFDDLLAVEGNLVGHICNIDDGNEQMLFENLSEVVELQRREGIERDENLLDGMTSEIVDSRINREKVEEEEEEEVNIWDEIELEIQGDNDIMLF